METKLYLYGVVKCESSKPLGQVGLSTSDNPNETLLHCKNGLGVVYREMEMEGEEELAASRRNMVSHQRIIEWMMKDYTVLPFAFGTFMDSIEALDGLIEERKQAFDEQLRKIEGKVELGLKLLWEKMDLIFEEIIQENEEIREKRQYLADHNIQNQDEKIELGKMVEAALDEKKEQMLKKALDRLLPDAIDHKVQKNISDAMFANVAFFVDKSVEKKFDEQVNALSEELGSNVVFKYVGPVAPVNFI